MICFRDVPTLFKRFSDAWYSVTKHSHYQHKILVLFVFFSYSILLVYLKFVLRYWFEWTTVVVKIYEIFGGKIYSLSKLFIAWLDSPISKEFTVCYLVFLLCFEWSDDKCQFLFAKHQFHWCHLCKIFFFEFSFLMYKVLWALLIYL